MSQPSVVLIGPMAAGKSSIGRMVGRMLGQPFRDSDRVIAAEHGPIPDIFAELGEARFREIERETIAGLLAEPGVLALGGGAVIDPRTREGLGEVPTVFLTVAGEVIARRLSAGGRPLLAGEGEPVQRWQRIFDERRAWYEEVADLTLDTSREPMTRIAETIAEWVRSGAPSDAKVKEPR